MTQDEIISMAREAGWKHSEHLHPIDKENLERFAAIVAAEHERQRKAAGEYEYGYTAGALAEREACAKVCDEISDKYRHPEDTAERVASEWCAAAIRARGEK